MDKYGSFRHLKEDAEQIGKQLLQNGSVVFCYSHDQVGAMIIFLSSSFVKLGTLPFGGNPAGRIYCGVYGRGFAHLSADKSPYGSYIDEKLNIHGQDAKMFSEFYTWIVDSFQNCRLQEGR